MLFKKFFLRRQFQKRLIENDVHRIVSQKEIKTVGIITTEEISQWINVKGEVEKILNLKDVKMYSFRPQNKNSNKYFSEKDFNWQGNIYKTDFKSFIDEPFDLLIGYFNKNNLFLESSVLQSNASFKVGISGVNQELYDIEIAETPIETERFFLELKKYLIIIRKLKN